MRPLTATGVFLAFFSLPPAGFAQEPEQPPRYVPGRLLVRAHRSAAAHDVAHVLAAVGARHAHDEINEVETLELPDHAVEHVAEALRRTGKFEYVERDAIAEPGIVPNDPSYTKQWHLPKIQAPEAWAVTTGSYNQTIAVIDSGADANHPDLKPRLVAGWNFLNSSSSTTDASGHGSWVSGAAAAAGNNALGVSGVSWKNRIMPLVVLDSRNYASYSSMAAAIRYAAQRGVRIINISLGGSTASSTLQSAVDYAWSRGAVVFAAAMNNGGSTKYYPAACDKVIAVAATDRYDNRASFSNFGSWIHLSSPGVSILTTGLAASYAYASGTSLATPVAAGVGALTLAANPSLTASQLVDVLQSTADNLGTSGFDSYYGYGRVNALRAVTKARLMAPSP